MTFNFLGPGLTVNVEAKVKEQIILDSSGMHYVFETCLGILSIVKLSSISRFCQFS